MRVCIKRVREKDLGQGVHTNVDGGRYTGDYSNNVRHGKRGVMIYNNGERYEGDWSNDVRDRLGKMTYKSKNI